jgi:succinoglycan biosynthesis protein ExoV
VILYQWRGSEPNFGDELNSLLWPRLLPDFFNHDTGEQFLGIGSILDDRHRRAAVKLVAGSGYGGYEAPIPLDETWIVHWVRGPRSARHLGLPLHLGIGDPASLIPLAGFMPARENRQIGFMPHFESAERGAWREVAALAGITLIDPRDDPLEIIAAIGQCRMIMSEALHGIIVADALRVPWIAVRPLVPIHRPKWLDWAETLGLTIEFQEVGPSTTLERAHLTQLSRFHIGRGVLLRHAARLRRFGRRRHVEQAAEALRAIAGADPLLSRDTALDEAQTRMLEAITALRRAPMSGWRLGKTSSVDAGKQPAAFRTPRGNPPAGWKWELGQPGP